MKKVAVIGSAGIPPRYGGFETLAQNLVLGLKSKFRFVVYCSRKLYNVKERQTGNHDADLVYLPVSPNGPQSIIYDMMAIFHAMRNVDIILILGVSGCLFLPLLKLFSTKKVITHIDGLEWKRQKWNSMVRLFLKLSESLAIKYSDYIVADNEAIKTYVMSKYNLVPELIEYGGDHTEVFSDNSEINKRYKGTLENYALAISRIEPENNIQIILDAFSCMPSRILIIVGNWENSRYSRRLRKNYGHNDNIFMYDPIYDQNIINKLRSGCEIYIHGYSAGGTNPSLVEAMYAGKPVIAYDAAFNRATTMNKALYFRNHQDLVSLLKNITPVTLEKNSMNMKEIAMKKYKWELISEKYASLFV